MLNRFLLAVICRTAMWSYKKRNTTRTILENAGLDSAMETTTKFNRKTVDLEYR